MNFSLELAFEPSYDDIIQYYEVSIKNYMN